MRSSHHGRAGAKVTLSLRVRGRRADGYHELDALVAIVDEPHDEVSIVDGAHDSELVIEPPGAAPGDGTNLAWKARAALGSTVGLRVRKRIPTEAGLGGGSADAAATLRLLGADRADDELQAIAVTLGADVPVCLRGGIAWMRGIGEIVEPLAPPQEPLHPVYLVLATPTFGCNTAEVYRAWDALGGPHAHDVVTPPEPWARVGAIVWQNDLEPAAVAVEPRLIDFRNAFADLAGNLPMLCGSGSTYYVVARDRDAASALADEVRVHMETRCVATATVGTMFDQ